MVIPILDWHSAAKEKSSTAAASLIILQNTLPSDWVRTLGELMRNTSLSPCWSYRQFPKEYLKEACVLHIQQEKCILKGKKPEEWKEQGNYLWWREMAETQSTDKKWGVKQWCSTTSDWTWNVSKRNKRSCILTSHQPAI